MREKEKRRNYFLSPAIAFSKREKIVLYRDTTVQPIKKAVPVQDKMTCALLE